MDDKTITHWREAISDAEKNLVLLESQQDRDAGELATLELEVHALGLDPESDLHAAADLILTDVAEALGEVGKKVTFVVQQVS